MSMQPGKPPGIVRAGPNGRPDKSPPRIKCRTCFTGIVAKPGESCADCWAWHLRTQEMHSKNQRCEVIGAIARLVGCTPQELIELIAGIVAEFLGSKEGAA
jgi:hypothetical protein